MIRFFFAAAAALALASCGNSSGVMDEIERAEQQQAQSRPALGAEVNEQPQTLPSGLQLQFTRRIADTSLPMPTINAMVHVHYEGSLVSNGEVFDSSFARNEPADFPLARVVPGFAEAITHMRPGDELIATFPGSLGYGASGSGPIPPNAALRFRIQLLSFQEPGGPTVQATQQ